MDKVCLVYLNSQLSPGMGVAYLLSYWREAGIDISFCDTAKVDLDTVIRAAQECGVVAMSVHTLAAGVAENVAQKIKSLDRTTKIIWGGPDAMARPDQLAKNPSVDFICMGEGEHFLPELFESGFDRATVGNYPNGLARPADCNGMLYPDLDPWRDWCAENYTPVMLGRGCPHHCTYCSNSLYHTLFKDAGYKYIRNRPMGEVFDEIEYRLGWVDSKGIGIHTETFGSQIKGFVDEYKARGCTFDYVTSSRPDALSLEKVRMMAETNCKYCGLGIESGSPTIRRKYLNRKMTDKQIIQAFKWLHEYGIDTHSFNIIGLPEESWATIQKLVKINQLAGVHKAQVTVLFPFPNTDIHALYAERGWLSPSLSAVDSYAVRNGVLSYYEVCAINHPNFTADQLLQMARLLPRVISGELEWKKFKDMIRSLV